MSAKTFIAKFFCSITGTCLFSALNFTVLAQTGGDVTGVFPLKITYPPLTEKEGKGLPLPVPPPGHPRLYFTKKDIQPLNEKWQSPLLNACVEKIKAAAAYSTDGILKGEGEKPNLDARVYNAIEAKAFLYVLQNGEASGRDAIAALLNFYATVKFDPAKQDVCREIGRTIVTGAIVYDWCYPLLTTGQKQVLIDRMEALATLLEVRWPYLVQGSVTGHGTEAQLSRDMLSCGIATYNEKPGIYNRVAGRILTEFAPARKFFYPAAYHHQGDAYGPYRFQWDVWAMLLFDRMGYPNLFGTDMAKPPYYFIYGRRPDGQLFRNGDDFLELSTPFGRYWSIGGSMEAYAGSYFKDPVLINEALKEGGIGKGGDYLFDFLFFDPAVQPSSKAALPLTKYFTEPFGAMTARTGWDEGLTASTAVAEMKIGVYNFVNHQHLDAGSFQLYYKGPLAVQSGIYQGKTGGYGSEHFKNYSQRTVAHNAMLVYDPAQKFLFGKQEIANDGGQPYPANGTETKTIEEIKAGYKTGEELAHSFGPDATAPDYSYLKGELALAYGPKVKSFQRSFVFLNLKDGTVPAALIVFDRVTAADKNFKKTWLLHCVEEPAINGNVSVAKRTEKGYGGQLQNTTLLPSADNLSIQKIGGAGNEFNVGGINYPQSPANRQNSVDSAVWRIEVSPKTASATDLFLNVMQVADADRHELLKVEKVEGVDFTGARIGDRTVLFSKTGEAITKAATLTLDGESTVLITDVGEGEWTIKDKEGKSTKSRVRKEERVIYIRLKAGTYRLSKNK